MGETVIAIGNPLGRAFARSVTVGVISAVNREISLPGPRGLDIVLTALQTDAPINPGNSGGPLVNTRGEVIGITSAKITDAGIEGIGFAIPSNQVKAIVEQLIAKGKVTLSLFGGVQLKGCSPGDGPVV